MRATAKTNKVRSCELASPDLNRLLDRPEVIRIRGVGYDSFIWGEVCC